ncbi:MAG: DUF4376 domain-containing protein [Caulobacteraceae bacterium]|nr:DUF4376 domain-containing protein [Caulobacteraceae bacterium]
MQKVYVTETAIADWTEADQAQASTMGAAQVVHVDGGYPAWLTDAGVSALGYFEIPEPGDAPTGLAGARALQLQALTARKLSALSAMAYQGYTVTLTAQDQIDIMSAVQQLTAAPAQTTVQWEIVDGTFLTFGLADVQALYAAGIAHIQACYANAAGLALAIGSAATVAEALAIDLTAGWPF